MTVAEPRLRTKVTITWPHEGKRFGLAVLVSDPADGEEMRSVLREAAAQSRQWVLEGPMKPVPDNLLDAEAWCAYGRAIDARSERLRSEHLPYIKQHAVITEEAV